MTARKSDHFDGRRFLNPSGADGPPLYMVPRLLMSPRSPWPEQVSVPLRRPPSLDGAAAAIAWIGHATFLIRTSAANLLIDPVYAERASPIAFAGPRRVRRPAIAFGDLPPIDVVLLSHCHYDHCDLETIRALAARFDPLVITPIGNRDLVEAAGARRVEELDWWERATTAPLGVTLTPAQHFSARTPLDRNLRLWGGFVIEAAGQRIFFAADSGYAGHFAEIPRRVGPIDAALLPIGAYEPRWFMKNLHMNPAEAVQAHLDLGARVSVAMHHGTFQLTPEGIDDPVRALEHARRARGVSPETFRVIDAGESVRLPIG